MSVTGAEKLAVRWVRAKGYSDRMKHTMDIPGVGTVTLYETEFRGHQGDGVIRTRFDPIAHVDGTPLSDDEERAVRAYLKAKR